MKLTKKQKIGIVATIIYIGMIFASSFYAGQMICNKIPFLISSLLAVSFLLYLMWAFDIMNKKIEENKA